MENTGSNVIYLRRETIIHINSIQIITSGGFCPVKDNLQNQERLDYIIGMVQSDDFYPTINHKAAF